MIQKSPKFPYHELSVDERLILVGEIWDSIADEAENLPMSPEHKAIVERRLAEYRAHPDRTFTWEEVKAHIRARSQQRKASA